ncbi:MAG: hypothetical protein ACP5T2_00820 [Thermoprotei archaeon]
MEVTQPQFAMGNAENIGIPAGHKNIKSWGFGVDNKTWHFGQMRGLAQKDYFYRLYAAIGRGTPKLARRGLRSEGCFSGISRVSPKQAPKPPEEDARNMSSPGAVKDISTRSLIRSESVLFLPLSGEAFDGLCN